MRPTLSPMNESRRAVHSRRNAELPRSSESMPGRSGRVRSGTTGSPDIEAARRCDDIAATTAPATTAPATTGPATTGPATTGPATTGPATTGPATTGPATTGPATT